MTWVNLKKIEARIESMIMVLINEDSGQGASVSSVRSYFQGNNQGPKFKEELPGWYAMTPKKRHAKVERVIARLIKGGRARLEKRPSFWGYDWYFLVPLNVLDKIVFAIELDDQTNG